MEPSAEALGALPGVVRDSHAAAVARRDDIHHLQLIRRSGMALALGGVDADAAARALQLERVRSADLIVQGKDRADGGGDGFRILRIAGHFQVVFRIFRVVVDRDEAFAVPFAPAHEILIVVVHLKAEPVTADMLVSDRLLHALDHDDVFKALAVGSCGEGFGFGRRGRLGLCRGRHGGRFRRGSCLLGRRLRFGGRGGILRGGRFPASGERERERRDHDHDNNCLFHSFLHLYDAMGIIPTLRETRKQGADILMKIKPVIPFFMKTLPALGRVFCIPALTRPCHTLRLRANRC